MDALRAYLGRKGLSRIVTLIDTHLYISTYPAVQPVPVFEISVPRGRSTANLKPKGGLN